MSFFFLSAKGHIYKEYILLSFLPALQASLFLGKSSHLTVIADGRCSSRLKTLIEVTENKKVKKYTFFPVPGYGMSEIQRRFLTCGDPSIQCGKVTPVW